jgi:hypothetical protein
MKKLTVLFLLFCFTALSHPKKKTAQLSFVKVSEPFKTREVTFVNKTNYPLWVEFRDEAGEEGFVLSIEQEKAFEIAVPLKQHIVISHFLLTDEPFFSKLRQKLYFKSYGIYEKMAICHVPRHMTAKIIEINEDELNEFIVQTKTTSSYNLSKLFYGLDT